MRIMRWAAVTAGLLMAGQVALGSATLPSASASNVVRSGPVLVTPAHLRFPPAPVGGASRVTRTVTYTNTGAVPIYIYNWVLYSPDFAYLTDTCATLEYGTWGLPMLRAGASCSITFRETPTVRGRIVTDLVMSYTLDDRVPKPEPFVVSQLIGWGTAPVRCWHGWPGFPHHYPASAWRP